MTDNPLPIQHVFRMVASDRDAMLGALDLISSAFPGQVSFEELIEVRTGDPIVVELLNHLAKAHTPIMSVPQYWLDQAVSYAPKPETLLPVASTSGRHSPKPVYCKRCGNEIPGAKTSRAQYCDTCSGIKQKEWLNASYEAKKAKAAAKKKETYKAPKASFASDKPLEQKPPIWRRLDTKEELLNTQMSEHLYNEQIPIGTKVQHLGGLGIYQVAKGKNRLTLEKIQEGDGSHDR